MSPMGVGHKSPAAGARLDRKEPLRPCMRAQLTGKTLPDTPRAFDLLPPFRRQGQKSQEAGGRD